MKNHKLLMKDFFFNLLKKGKEGRGVKFSASFNG